MQANVIEKVRSKKAPLTSQTRKALQVLQVTASDENVLISSPGTMPKKVLKPAEESLKISKLNDQSTKEILPRRSKRKNIDSENQTNVASKEEKPSSSKSSKAKITKSSRSKKKVANVEKPTNEPQNLPHQSSLDSYISVGSKSTAASSADVLNNVINESESDTVLEDELGMYRMRVINSASDETDVSTSKVTTDSYWKTIAEERRKALEIALLENSQLKDELEVQDTEISQLKGLLKEAEKVIEIVNAMVA